jgi:DNA-binding CsgD family transcriptional regulator
MRFKVQATPEGTVPVEWAAGLLAMHCVVRGQRPCDYTVLVVPREGLPDSIGQRAQELLAASQETIGYRARVTRREGEVLQCVLKQESNKEIGSHLNLSERTVKFHVSALLAKFKARDRIDLMSKAAVGLLPTTTAPPDTLFGFPMDSAPEQQVPVSDIPRSNENRPALVMRNAATG